MSESNLSDDSSSVATTASDEMHEDVDPALAAAVAAHEAKLNVKLEPGTVEEDTRTPEEKAEDDRIVNEVKSFTAPAGFTFVIPNLALGCFTKFMRATDHPCAVPQTPEQHKAAEATENLIAQFGCEYALLFSATDVDMKSINLADWHPLPAPKMEGQAKVVLVHRATWKFLEGYSLLLRHHPSLKNRRRNNTGAEPDRPTLSEAYEIYALTEDGAYREYTSKIECTLCAAKPAPVKCAVCETYYCTPTCLSLDKQAHQVPCVSSLVKSLALTVKTKRETVNTKMADFRRQQAEFAERNRGKIVPVYRMDSASKKWIETHEIVVPEAAAAPTSCSTSDTGPQSPAQK